MPYSPNATLVPPVAAPCRSGRCCLRCATLRGMSMPQPSSLTPAAASTGAAARAAGSSAPDPSPRSRRPVAPVSSIRPVSAVAPLASAQRGLGRLALRPGGRGFAPVDPDLDPDPAERRTRHVEAVVDVRAQRVQRHPPLAVELRPRHFRATEPTGALHPDSPGAAL